MAQVSDYILGHLHIRISVPPNGISPSWPQLSVTEGARTQPLMEPGRLGLEGWAELGVRQEVWGCGP